MAKQASAAVLKVRRDRVARITPLLRALYPDAKCSLNFKTPLQLLVATMLSAQCTDERVNKVTPALFKKYKSAAAFAAAPQEQLEKDIQSTGFFRNKAKNIRAMAAAIVDLYGGTVPNTMEQLYGLAGVGRKTANVVLGDAFNIQAGVTVDTHVTRLANRLMLTKHEADAVKIEQDLVQIVPQADWTIAPHLLILHGRQICHARKPKCLQCAIRGDCPSGDAFIKKGLAAPAPGADDT